MTGIIKRLFWADNSPLQLPWFKTISHDHRLKALHLMIFANQWKSYGIGRVFLISQTLFWPIVCCAKIIYGLLRNGNAVKQGFKVGYTKQLWAQFRLGWFHNLASDDYYYYRLYEIKKICEIEGLLIESQKACLLSKMNASQDCTVFNNKAKFYHECQQHELPVIPTLAVIQKNHIIEPKGKVFFPRVDLFAKGWHSSHGNDSELWRFLSKEDKWLNGDLHLSQEQLIEHFKSDCCGQMMIVQPRIINHTALERYAIVGLCTVRIITCRLPDESPEVLGAALRMPIGDCHVDNCSAGGIAAGISIEKGELGRAVSHGRGSIAMARHPDTGAMIEGAVMPFWAQTLELAIRAHGIFGKFVTLGWDIAIGPTGPILVECNTNWGAWLAQVPTKTYLGDTRFPQCCTRSIVSVQ